MFWIWKVIFISLFFVILLIGCDNWIQISYSPSLFNVLILIWKYANFSLWIEKHICLYYTFYVVSFTIHLHYIHMKYYNTCLNPNPYLQQWFFVWLYRPCNESEREGCSTSYDFSLWFLCFWGRERGERQYLCVCEPHYARKLLKQ